MNAENYLIAAYVVLAILYTGYTLNLLSRRKAAREEVEDLERRARESGESL